MQAVDCGGVDIDEDISEEGILKSTKESIIRKLVVRWIRLEGNFGLGEWAS